MHLIALADNSARYDYDEETLAQKLDVTTKTARKRLAHLEELGYIFLRDGGIELHADLVMGADDLLVRELSPLSDEEFARLQQADDPDKFLKEHTKQYTGKKLFVDLPRALIEGHPCPKRP
jgi:DNA-binding transcriptional MocR family regulator